MHKMQCVVFDCDGVLADSSHRRHVGKNWAIATEDEVDEWHSRHHLDRPIKPMMDLAWSLRRAGYAVVVLTSRCQKQREDTRKWLAWQGLPVEDIYCREVGERTPNHLYKARKIREIQERYDIRFALDDEPAIVDTYRQAGIFCLQVPHNVAPYGLHVDLETRNVG
jgi:phosphoglycolate phosphatase-like HAD superfamily hydrolase